MTTIDRLVIQGVRSFSPNEQQIIDFDKPLTIICGQNGAGKTTIIECLKQACTGETPPNSDRGRSFVHNSRSSNRGGEVKASIKLAMHDYRRQQCLVSRVFQLTPEGRFEQLQNTLVLRPPGVADPMQVPLRFNEINAYVPELMGASLSVLESVIFCHQEDSNWPLTDAASLKARFDEIFAASRYTKALDQLKKARLDMRQKTELLRKDVDAAGERVRRVQERRTELADKQARHDHLRAQSTARGTELEERRAELARLQVAMEATRALRDRVRLLEARVDEKRTDADRIVQELGDDLFNDETALLQEQLQRIEARVQAQQNRVVVANDELREVDERRRRRATESATLARRDGELRRVVEQLREERARAARARGEVARVAGVPAPAEGATMSAAAQRDFDERVSQAVAHEDTSAEQRVGALRRSTETAAGECDRLGRAEAQLTEKMAACDRLQQTLAKRRIDLDAAARRFAGVREQLGDAKRRADEADAASEGAQSSAQLQQLRVNVDRAEERRRTLRAEHTAAASEQSRLAGQRDALVRLKMLRDAEEQTRKRVAALRADLAKPLADALQVSHEYVATEAAVSALRADCTRTTAALARDEKAKAAALASAQQSSGATVGQRDAAADTVAELQRRLEGARAKLEEHGVDDATDVERELREAEKRLQDVRSDMATLDAVRLAYHKFRDAFAQTRACPLCTRCFTGAAEEDAFGGKLEVRTNELGTELPALRRRVDEHEARVRALRDVLPMHVVVVRIRDVELPEAEKRLSALESAVLGDKEAAQKLSAEHASVRARLDSLRALVVKVDEVVALGTTLEEQERQIRQEQQQSWTTGGGGEALDAAQSVAARVEETQRALGVAEQECTQAAAALRDAEQSAARLSNDAASARNRVRELESQMREAERVADELRRVADDETGAQRDRAAAAEEAGRVAAQLADARLRLTESQRAQARADQEAGTQRAQRQQALAELRRATDAVRTLEVGSPESEAERVREALRQAEGDDRTDEQTRQQLTERVAEAESMLRRADGVAASIRKNLQYRAMREEIDRLQAELDAGRGEVQAAAGTAEDAAARMQRVQAEVERALGAVHDLEGQSRVVASDIHTLSAFLASVEATGAVEDLRKKQVEAAMTEAAVEDIQRFHVALAKAVMRYHQLKMDEINKIIRELWRTTYRGRDIDWIEIRADGRAGAAGASTRTFDYRVVMMHGRNELEMRGRCSAGQKVLASLVIRLALAEAFCVNCGILALDEPTTNLDRENIESLANALNRIIELRRQHSNFQLVVITHDEEFVRLLGRSQYATRYWRVSKNQDQCSVIRQEAIGSLM